MSVVSYGLTTRTKVKSFLGITDSSSDTIIDELINYVTDYIESMCGRRFLETTYTGEEYDTKETTKIFLKNYPVSTLSSVEYRSGIISSPTWNTYDVNGYLLYGPEGYVKFFSRLSESSKGIRFTYTAGFKIDFTNEGSLTLHTLPYDISLVATELVAKLHDTRKSEGVLSMTTEGQSITYQSSVGDLVTKGQKSIISAYQAHRFSL